jgi:hypothetical protein
MYVCIYKTTLTTYIQGKKNLYKISSKKRSSEGPTLKNRPKITKFKSSYTV